MKFQCLSFAWVLAAAFACSDDDHISSGIDNLSPKARQFVSMRLATPLSERVATTAALQQSYHTLLREALDYNGGRKADTAEAPLPGAPWKTCAVITETDNADGSVTTTYDYGGRGCVEGWGDYYYRQFGKFIQTSRFITTRNGTVFTTSYLFNTRYENYGGQHANEADRWFTDGTTFYEGTSQYDTASGKFSGAYHFHDTTSYGYGDVTHAYLSNGSSEVTETGAVTSAVCKYAGANDMYQSVTIKPLVYRYNCPTSGFGEMPLVWVAVEGQESITHVSKGEASTFEINYGDGSCDNIIYVTEGGKTVKVDLGEMWPINSRLPSG